VRQGAAWSAVATAIVWSLAVLFVLDVQFEFGIPERAILLVLAVGGTIWAAWKYAVPLLRVRESEEDTALLVERQQQIDSDLIAAIQFERQEAASWGSAQLEQAVIDYVAQVGRGIDVFAGFSAALLRRRAGILAASLVVVIAVAAVYPAHTAAFLQRLLLGKTHYPTDTVIERVFINRQEVLRAAARDAQPRDTRCAQGRPISFLVECRGVLPEKGIAQISTLGGLRSRTIVPVTRLSLDERLGRLREGQSRLTAAMADAGIDVSEPWQAELRTLLAADAPRAAALISGDRRRLAAAETALAEAIATWPGDAPSRALYAGTLDRLVSGIKYKLAFGDAWTDPARITMIPLPIVERRLTPTPPSYAQHVEKGESVTAPQLAVLEGTRIDVAVACRNGKRLKSVWMIVRQGDSARRLELSQADGAGRLWRLAATAGRTTPLDRVTRDLSYELQVLDEDGLSLDSPLKGQIRIRLDRPPSGAAEIVHKVVLPTAEPVVEYQAADDFGVAGLRLHVAVERRAEESVATMPPGQSASVTQPPVRSADSQMESTVLEIGAPSGPRTKVDGKFVLKLAQLSLSRPLEKGDRVKLTLEVVDFRGDQPGTAYSSDPLVLEISDESGVLAAISEADPRSEERLTDIIKRQLGIGESP
jgi:hypothetical protein